MGCDIHMYAETLDKQGNWQPSDTKDFVVNKWIANLDKEEIEDDEGILATNVVATERNYWLFGVLNNVRSEWPFSFSDKGFPDNASDCVRKQFDYWESDAHSPNYLTKRELSTKIMELLISHEKDAFENATYLTEINDKLFGDPDTQRVVFWFDN